ncbi:protein Skeletor, isoforms B/C isoform X3 [Plodia interpunctella]|nr:protein Skeletor, isoforms B/C isoform X2 [Plodia interpunctella]XP_053619755.1 protein Skeletor, isoforms B/C isoform X3 [Plodia interpunctella]
MFAQVGAGARSKTVRRERAQCSQLCAGAVSERGRVTLLVREFCVLFGMRLHTALAVLAIGACLSGARGQRYFGKELGALSELHHGVRGRVFAVDSRTLFLKDFHYDGEGPAAYFYVGSSKSPSSSGGLRLRDERGGSSPLRRYRGEGVTLSLPDGKTLRDVKWFSVWCDEFSVNFGDVSIPRDLEFPKPAKVGALRGVHGVSSDAVVVVDAQTLLVPNFSYDGEAPDAKFWVGRGDKPSPQGIRIPDENGKEAPLRKYDRKTIVLTLPGELTVFDIGHFAVWCEAFTVNFGHVTLPRSQLANVPPSLKMLGVSPQSKLNCEVLHDELAFEVRWAVAGDSIVLQLVGKLEDGEYMSFGISGDPSHSQMVGGDVAVAWVDKATLKGYAVDYYLDAKSQCAGVRGSCPDERLGEKTNSIRLLNAALVNGYSIVTYQRSLKAADELDRAVLTNTSQPVIWALGPLNSRNEVSYHHHFTKGDKFIEFGRAPVWNCPMPENEEDRQEPPRRDPPSRQPEANKAVIKPNPVPTPRPVPRAQPWDIPAIQCYEPPDGVFYAQMGPTGGKQGYSAITGHVGWGISWYINGLLIPEINVVRGKKYTFVVEGGSNPDVPARYHPFYITNDPVGGYLHRSDEEKKNLEIYAGVRRSRSGELIPTGVGRLCNWTPDPNGPGADEYPSFGAYQRSLTLECEPGNPGIVTWTPDRSTPDTVFYQCFTHRYLGWKINVVDECDAAEAEESRVVAHVAPADLAGEESVQ